ncbi:hypothetical protein pdul_cds_653 [Pandoravirus dulcis]|uniref:Transmembrane protein n=1 Tax=Pandoravirus dulcis TaxID=1349409 RepID=S4VR04_9VIRU|nr:hypothetical protein pdul_cds_653 [Pandoravirus dulcis]AGO82798.1 hypothetical protein pdul_cds_653 [Pandoravirus dulcis]
MSQSPAIAPAEAEPLRASVEVNDAPVIQPVFDPTIRSWGNEVDGMPSADETAVVQPLGTLPSTTAGDPHNDDDNTKSRACRCNYKMSGKTEEHPPGATARSPAPTPRCQTVRTWILLLCIIVVAGGAAAAFSYYNYYPATAAVVVGTGEVVINNKTHADVAVAPQADATDDGAQCACVCTRTGPLAFGRLVVDARGSHCSCPCKLPEAKEATGVCSCNACTLAFVAASLFIVLGLHFFF